jgi:hypothetical protein
MLEGTFTLDRKAIGYAERRIMQIPGAMPKAAERAINRTLTRAKTRWSQAVAREFRVKKGEAAASMRISRALAKRRKLYGEVYAVGKRMELIKFAGRQKPWSQYKRRPKVGAWIQVRRSGSKERVPGAFVERGRKSGKLHVMWRKRSGGKVAPREAVILYGPSPEQMAKRTAPNVQREMSLFFRRRFIHETKHILRKGAVGGRKK